MGHHKNNSEVIISIVVVCICTAILLLWLATVQKIPLSTLIQNVCTNFYPAANMNIFMVKKICNINAYIYIYFLSALSAVIAIFFKHLWAKTKEKKESPSHSHTVFLVALIVFFITVGIQTVDQIKGLSQEVKIFSGKTLSQKNSIIFDTPYYFAMYCRALFPEGHRGKFITDLDITRDPAMTLHERLCYHLYPINIKVPTGQPIDCYIIFHKKDPTAALTEDFKKLYFFDQFNVLALKEEPD